MRIYDGTNYRDLTPEEISIRNTARRKAAMEEHHRPLTEVEVARMLIPNQVNGISVDDNMALRMIKFYPEWLSGIVYDVGFKVSYGNKLWRVLQKHTSQVGWEPENAVSLWEQISRTHTGNETDPIPYEGNMRLENGKYYIQNEVVYKCTRDSGNPVYHALSDLIGLYVEEVYRL